MAHITPCVKDGLLHCLGDGWQRGICVESNTTLYTFGQRYYDTDLGRWTQMDPVGGTVGNPNSGNPYVYANDLPNMLTDPTGRITCIGAGILLGAVTVLAAITLIATGPVAPLAGLGIFLVAEVGILQAGDAFTTACGDGNLI